MPDDFLLCKLILLYAYTRCFLPINGNVLGFNWLTKPILSAYNISCWDIKLINTPSLFFVIFTLSNTRQFFPSRWRYYVLMTYRNGYYFITLLYMLYLLPRNRMITVNFIVSIYCVVFWNFLELMDRILQSLVRKQVIETSMPMQVREKLIRLRDQKENRI